jgi:uncharacterized protein YdhG (YjbR/CyaY superfamily)
LRTVILAAAPEVEECIGYGIPCYKQNGMVISMAAYKNHCSLYPGHTLRDFSEELKGFKMSKGGIQFPHDAPPSDELVTRMVKARAAENSDSEWWMVDGMLPAIQNQDSIIEKGRQP